MKRVLITGAQSYIGEAVAAYLARWPRDYGVTTLDMRTPEWHAFDFSGYDAVFHVAGVAHVKEKELADVTLYEKVNTHLAVETAQKAKAAGCAQFILMSSMSVYGLREGSVSAQTKPAPNDRYGESKLRAEQGVAALEGDEFAVCILRPPMIYGKGCKGNYQRLRSLALRLGCFPKVNNARSMLYIGNLCVCVRDCIEQGLCGVLCPVNAQTICTSEFAREIRAAHGKRIYLSFVLGIGARLLKTCVPAAQKAFGSLAYDDTIALKISEWSTRRSIEETEGA